MVSTLFISILVRQYTLGAIGEGHQFSERRVQITFIGYFVSFGTS